MLDKRKIVLAFCAVVCAVGIGTDRVDAFRQSFPGMSETAQYILNVVNTESGATRFSGLGRTAWAYSLDFPDPCTLNLTEERKTLNKTTSGDSATPLTETTHYLIPAADLEFGKYSSHHTLEPGFMRVIIFANRATIRRWRGPLTTPLEDVPVVFTTSINFGKPNVDIFDVPLRFENALKHLTCLCRAEVTPAPHDGFCER